MSENNNKEYETKFGNFIEDPTRPGVYLAEEIDQSELTVPASVSRTGQDIPLNVSPTTVFITPDNGQRALPFEISLLAERERGTPEGSGNSTSLDRVAYFNNLSLVASLANSSGFPSQIQRASQSNQNKTEMPNTLLPVRIALATSTSDTGPFALVTNNNGGGIINLGDDDLDTTIASLAGVPNIRNLNLNQSEIEGFESFITGHEVKHLNDDRVAGQIYDDWETYRAEVRGDHDTLNTYFNDDFYQLAMDVRALGSLNNPHPVDDHATHIWSEEFQAGLMPTEDQAAKIMRVPASIYDELNSFISDTYPYDDEEVSASIDTNPAERYIYLARMRADGSLDGLQSQNEYTFEYVDKYIGAAERRYPSEQINEASQRVLMRDAQTLVWDAEPDPDLSEGDVADMLRDDPAYYYGNMKVLRENGMFDNIPRANEIIDMRLAQIQQENPELVRNIDMNSYRIRYQDEEAPEVPMNTTQTNIPSVPAAIPANAPI